MTNEILLTTLWATACVVWALAGFTIATAIFRRQKMTDHQMMEHLVNAAYKDIMHKQALDYVRAELNSRLHEKLVGESGMEWSESYQAAFGPAVQQAPTQQAPLPNFIPAPTHTSVQSRLASSLYPQAGATQASPNVP